jgi:hypothetical protein
MRFASKVPLVLAGLTLCGAARLLAQPQQFQFVVSAIDASGKPIADLKPEDVLVSENGVRVPVSKVDPYAVPLKVTVTVDNGSDIVDALGHIRAGLTGFVEALPRDVEVTLISTSPQPRTVVKPTTDHAQILRGVNGFAPEADQRPRFTDALVEFGQRLRREERDLKSGKIKPYMPVLVMVSTAANEQTSYEPNEIQNAVNTIIGHKTRMFVVITTTKVGDANQVQDIDRNRQAMISRPVTKATNGKFETLATSIRLTTLLPEWGEAIGSLHTRQSSQFVVTVQRATSGPLQMPQFDLRNNLRGNVTTDGFLVQ